MKGVELTPIGLLLLLLLFLVTNLLPCQCFRKHQSSEQSSSEETGGSLDKLWMSSASERATLTVCLRCISLLLRGAAATSDSTSSSVGSPLLPESRICILLCFKGSTGFSLLLSKLLIANLRIKTKKSPLRCFIFIWLINLKQIPLKVSPTNQLLPSCNFSPVGQVWLSGAAKNNSLPSSL